MATITLYSDTNLAVKVDSAATPRLRVVTKPLGAASNYPPSGDLSRRVRLLANIALEDASNPGAALTNLRQTVTIEVSYTNADRVAAGGTAVKFGYWDGSKWVRFGNYIDRPDPDPNKGGSGTASFTNWSADPPLAVGH